MKKQLFFSLVLGLSLGIFLPKTPFAIAQYTPSAYFKNTGTVNAGSVMDNNTNTCSGPTSRSGVWVPPNPNTTLADVGTTVPYWPCRYLYYSGPGCTGTRIGESSCSTALVTNSTATYTCSSTNPSGTCPPGQNCQALATGGVACQPSAAQTCEDGTHNCASGGSPAQGGASCSAYPGTSAVSDSSCTSLYCCKPNNIPNGYQTCYGPDCNTTMQPYDIGGICNGSACNTALGPISTTDFQSLAKSLFAVILSVAGLIAAVLIIISGYKLVMSRGNPEKVQDAREQLTAAIVGLLFIIFSLVFLEFIGLDVLGLPNFIG